MTKIVINTCHGGFGLSPRAMARLATIQGKECFFFKGLHRHEHITEAEAANEHFWQAYSVSNPDEIAGSQSNWHGMTAAERQASNERWNAITIEAPKKRDDPVLVQIVSELDEDANGSCAKLKIVEVPDGVEWQIEEYDGREWVSEVHQTWD